MNCSNRLGYATAHSQLQPTILNSCRITNAQLVSKTLRLRLSWSNICCMRKKTLKSVSEEVELLLEEDSSESCFAVNCIPAAKGFEKSNLYLLDLTAVAEDILEVKTLRNKLDPRESPFAIDNLGGCGFVGDKDLISLQSARYETESSSGAGCPSGVTAADGTCLVHFPPWGRRAGPRKTIYYSPAKVTAAIVTCGGLCPGLNDVVQNIVSKLLDYGVPDDRIFGVKYGLRGFLQRDIKPIPLTLQSVEGIHLQGGTILGTSRGGADVKEIVKVLERWDVNMLFCIGGNGGNAAANAIQLECERAGVTCSVVGVPKSIDNDILLIDRCFGYDTAVEESSRCLLAAKVEARSAFKGLGIIRLMGRSSGLLAMNAAMASGVVDVCLIPEVRWELHRLMDYVDSVIRRRGHAVVCVAEGCGQGLFQSDGKTDASGNPVLSDVGVYLRDQFKAAHPEYDIKYIDPTYLVRALPTNSSDRILCKVLGQASVHGAFAGYTGFTTGAIGHHFCMLPIDSVVQAVRTVDPRGRAWSRLKGSINQPHLHSQDFASHSNGVYAA